MTIKELENESIDQLILKDKWSVFENEVLEIPDYSYWASQEPLNASYQIRNIKWWSKTLYFTKLASAWTWIVNYTWFWFTPTAYIIQAWYKWALSWTSTSYCTNFWWVIWWFYQYPWYQNENTLRAIVIWNAWATITTRANFSSFIPDWIALDFVDSGNDVVFTITAFK